jgi:hypothetical protein
MELQNLLLFTKNIKVKEYQLANLLDRQDDIINRCHLIEKVSNSVSFIPNTQITSNGESLKYRGKKETHRGKSGTAIHDGKGIGREIKTSAGAQ